MRVVDEHLDDDRLNGLFNLGYTRFHTSAATNTSPSSPTDTGRVVWVAKGRNQAALTSFFEALGESRCRQIKAMSMDLAPIWRDPCEWFIPQAAICLDPFHVVRFANRALDAVYQSMRFEQGQAPATANGAVPAMRYVPVPRN